MILDVKQLEIKDVQFVGNSVMLLSLSNERTFMIPLDQFQDIAALSSEQKKDFEVIDGENLSFLALDEVYNLSELIGLKSI
jgi:hypothetical protein